MVFFSAVAWLSSWRQKHPVRSVWPVIGVGTPGDAESGKCALIDRIEFRPAFSISCVGDAIELEECFFVRTREPRREFGCGTSSGSHSCHSIVPRPVFYDGSQAGIFPSPRVRSRSFTPAQNRAGTRLTAIGAPPFRVQ